MLGGTSRRAAASRWVSPPYTHPKTRLEPSELADPHHDQRKHHRAGRLGLGWFRAAMLPPVMVWVSQLARLQRASLALCVYGGLTHREAAALLDVPPSTVADLLTAGLRELGRLSAGAAATFA